MASLLRYAVASPRNQYSDSKYTLDLAYITPWMIVCSMPTSETFKSWYRIPTSELASFLQRNHGSNWQIFNFRAEQGMSYKDSEFNNQVSHFPFPDHQPPPFELIPKFVGSLDKLLLQNDRNVAVLHCKAGQGRSGTMCCAYLMTHNGLTPAQAIELFTQKRMRTGFGPGVSIYSQLRYLHYVEKWLQNDRAYDAFGIVQITSLKLFNNLYHDLEIICSSFADGGRSIIDKYVFDDRDLAFKSDLVVEFRPRFQLYVPVDVKISFNHRVGLSQGLRLIQSTSTSYVWFNTYFEEGEKFEVMWDEMDGFIGTHKKGSRSFDRMQVEWRRTLVK